MSKASSKDPGAVLLERVRETVRRHCHEVRQPLLGIKGYSELMAQSPSDPKLIREGLHELVTQTQRVVRLVDELQAAIATVPDSPSGPEGPDSAAQPADIAVSLYEALRLFGYRVTSSISAHLDVPADLPKVRMPADRLERIAINLISNALDALGEKGDLQIRARLHVQEGRRAVAIEFADDGRGIPPELRERLFQPGATSKSGADGVLHGLGLAICRDLALEAGGGLELCGEEDRGPRWSRPVRTVFRLVLPAV
jgi:signal transduction histidine kinase